MGRSGYFRSNSFLSFGEISKLKGSGSKTTRRPKMISMLLGLVAVAACGIALLLAGCFLEMLYRAPEQLLRAALNGLRILFDKRSKRKEEKARINEIA